MNTQVNTQEKILVLGASGYVGARLIMRLLDRGYRVLALGRSADKLLRRPWGRHPLVEIKTVNVLDKTSLKNACKEGSIAYYLVHSMESGQKDFVEADRQAARNMIEVATQTGLQRIIYIGGLGKEEKDLSKHLRSRVEVGEILKSGKVPVTILRAAMIIGSGSISFEIVRYLMDRLPIMITPLWLKTESQPIAIRNVLDYLIGCLLHPVTIGETYDIGGPEIISYRQLLDIYGEVSGVGKKFILKVPILTPLLSAYWINFVTPISIDVAHPLAEGLKTKMVCQENRIRDIIKQELLDCRQAIKMALDRNQIDLLKNFQGNQFWSAPPEWTYPGDPVWSGGDRLKGVRDKIVIQ